MEVQMDGIKIYKYSNKSPSLVSNTMQLSIYYILSKSSGWHRIKLSSILVPHIQQRRQYKIIKVLATSFKEVVLANQLAVRDPPYTGSGPTP